MFKMIAFILALGLGHADAAMLVGNWGQPCESAAKWISDLGPQVVFVNPDRGGKSITDTVALCKANGVKKLILTPDSPDSLNFLLNTPEVIAINLGDEPSLKSPNYNDKDGGVAFKAFVAAWMAKNKWIADGSKGKKPLFLNHAGPKIGAGAPNAGYQGQNEAPYSLLTGPGDYLGLDFYPMNNQGQTGRYTNDYVGQALARSNAWWPGRTPFVFLESSFTMEAPLTGRAPSPADMEAQLASALAQGAKGIFFFTHAFKACPWERNAPAGKTCWDMRTPELVLKTREIAQRLNGTPTPTPVPNARLDALEATVKQLDEKVQSLEAVIKKIQDL